MKKWLCCLLLCLLLLPAAVSAEEPAGFLEDAEAGKFGRITHTYDSPTLKYTVDRFRIDGERCRLVRVWVQDPARQIVKATAEWEKSLEYPKVLAASVEGMALAINGSGYVSPKYPEIPENYPGESKDYFYTPLGSLTVTGGEVLRDLEGVPYYGIALTGDGLRMYTGEDNETVLADEPKETWSFYETCPMLRDNEDLLPEDWPFADRRAARTVIARLDKNNYLILVAEMSQRRGITLRRAQSFFRNKFEAEWVYNLDGGPSSALIVRERGKKKIKVLSGAGAKDFDIMAFIE